jgi:predicted metal-dependent hydrolase
MKATYDANAALEDFLRRLKNGRRSGDGKWKAPKSGLESTVARVRMLVILYDMFQLCAQTYPKGSARLMRAEDQLEEAAEQIWQIHRSRKNRRDLRKQALSKLAALRKQQGVAGGAI